jgi:chromosome partitioning protein
VSQSLIQVCSIVNGKGGALKTSLVANIGGLCAAAGYRTLLVDLDPQGNLGLDLGYYEQGDHGAGLLDAMSPRRKPLQVLSGIRPNLDVVPGGVELKVWAGYAMAAGADSGRFLGLRRALAPVANNYDLILIDCPPGDEELQTQALAASRFAVVPAPPDMASRLGMVRVSELFDKVRTVNDTLELLGVVLTRIPSGATAERRQTVASIVESFGDAGVVFATAVRDSFKTAKQARDRGVTVFEYENTVVESESYWAAMKAGRRPQRLASESAARGLAQDYEDLTKEFLTRRADRLSAAVAVSA